LREGGKRNQSNGFGGEGRGGKKKKTGGGKNQKKTFTLTRGGAKREKGALGHRLIKSGGGKTMVFLRSGESRGKGVGIDKRSRLN